MKETEQREARSPMRRGMLRDVACGCDNQRGLIWQAPISFLVWQLISDHVRAASAPQRRSLCLCGCSCHVSVTLEHETHLYREAR